MADDNKVIPFRRKKAAKTEKIYVTYDVNETGNEASPLIYRSAKEILIQGILLSWEVGEFKVRGVEEVYGVKLRFRAAETGMEKEEIVDTSRYARNVQVFIGKVPKEYQEALLTSA